MSAALLTAKSITTPPVSRKPYGCPIASGTTRMSLKRIAASNPNRRTGCNVTSTASSGVCTSSTNEYVSLSRRYSGSARPAWRMSQTGGRSTDRHWQALENRWRPVIADTSDALAGLIEAEFIDVADSSVWAHHTLTQTYDGQN